MNTLTRRGMRLALMTLGFAGLIVAVNAVPAAATPSGGFHPTELARGTDMSHGTLPITEGLQVVVTTITLDSGGFSGWHSHPGGAIVVIKAGEVTFHVSVGNHCEVTTYKAGQAFIERPGEVGIAVAGSNGAIIYATFPGVPAGGLTKIDQPDPGTCPGL
jgi:quercetin dioxygenase-like cupin family protein